MDVHAGLRLCCLHAKKSVSQDKDQYGNVWMCRLVCAFAISMQKIKIPQAKHQYGNDAPNQVPIVFGPVHIGANVGIGVISVLCA